MTVAEITQAVNEEYDTQFGKSDVQKFVRLLVYGDYVERRQRGLHAYYQPLGMDYLTEDMFQ